MDINQLIVIVKKKIDEKLNCEEIIIEDKTFYLKLILNLLKINSI